MSTIIPVLHVFFKMWLLVHSTSFVVVISIINCHEHSKTKFVH